MILLIKKKVVFNKLFQGLFLIIIYLFTISSSSFGQQSDLKFRKISREQGLSNSTVECIYQDKEGFMWFGTADGLNKYDVYKTIVYQNNPTDSLSIKDNYINSILEDKNQNLWVSTGTGLNRFNRDKNNFTRFTSQPDNTKTISSNSVNCIYEDKQNNIWFGSMEGLNLLEKSGNSFKRFSNLKNGLQANNISCLFEDSLGNFWLGTYGAGLFQFDRNTAQFK